ncbi:MAG TPA: hypothetical protein VGD01_10955 [Candidatus Elarobacter sp.]
MHIFSTRPARLVRALFAVSFIAVAGCGGGSSSSSTVPNGNGVCDANAGSIAIARPTAGFPSNGNSVEIVSSTSSDELHGNPGAFDLILVDNFNQQTVTGLLTILPDNNGPHPYANDFYYQGTLSTGLLSGRTYNVFLNAPNSSCTPGFVGSFTT